MLNDHITYAQASFYAVSILVGVTLLFAISTEASARTKPPAGSAVPAQYDEEGNPEYYYILNEDIDESEMQLTDVLYLENEGSKDNQKPIAGWMDFSSYAGWRNYHEHCHVCHGPDGMGSSYAPPLKDSMDVLTWDEFFDVVVNGRGRAQGARVGNVMPSFGENPNVVLHIENLYRYLKMRHDGKVRRGTRLPRLPKYIDPEEEEG